MSAKGEINLAPYSFFNAVSDSPPIVMFSSDGYKDSLAFIAETREFVCNLAVFDLIAAVVTTGISYPRGINEMTEAGLDALPSRLVRPPRVKASPCALECKLLQIVDLKDLDGRAVSRSDRWSASTSTTVSSRMVAWTPPPCVRSRAAAMPTTR